MVRIIRNLDEFLNSNFKTISLGLTPSGSLHIGFLTTLACAFLYLRENANSSLIITTLENTLDANVKKYNELPIRYQYLGIDGKLEVPKNLEDIEENRKISKRITAAINDLVWKLVQLFDNKTSESIKQINNSEIPDEHKKAYRKKYNKIAHIFSNHIYIYSLLEVLERDKSTQRTFAKILTEPESIKEINKLIGLDSNPRDFGKEIYFHNKTYQPQYLFVPVKLSCPKCKSLCKGWAKVVLGNPEYGSPKFVSRCNNSKCSIGITDEYVIVDPFTQLDQVEFYFLLGILRDFIKPFKADCRVFGGDYFQIESTSTGRTTAQRLAETVNYFESKFHESKAFFGGPMITMDGLKMSKTSKTFKLDDIENISKVFLNILSILEKSKKEDVLQFEYSKIIR